MSAQKTAEVAVVPKGDSASTVSASKDQTSNATNDSSSGIDYVVDPSKVSLDQDLNPSDDPMMLIAVLFKEAALDSPTFRTSMNHLNIQFENLDRWLTSFITATQKLSQEMEGMLCCFCCYFVVLTRWIVLQELANAVISKFVPSFVTQGITDHDYTMLAMRRYAESSRHFWTNIIKKVRSQHAGIIEPLVHFQRNELKRYKESRKLFENLQGIYDNSLSKYLSLSKNKEPSALREDAFQLSEAHKAYIKASFDLGCTMSVIQSKLDICLVRTLSHPWILSPKEFAVADPVAQRIGVEMLRLRSWAKSMQKSSKPLMLEMQEAAKDMERAAIERFAPSRDLNSYTVQNSTIPRFVPKTFDRSGGMTEKHGWLFVKSSSAKGVRQLWVRRWIFVKNGMFGMLNISPSKTFVQESDKIGVLLCHVTPVSTEDRRFVFEVKTKSTVILFQAETLEELKSWLQVFEDAKRVAIESDKKSAISFAFQQTPPMIAEFASTAGTTIDMELTHDKGMPAENGSSGEAPVVNNCITLMSNSDAANLQALMTAGESMVNPNTKGINGKIAFSSIGPFGASLAPSPLLNIAMPTSMSQEAILSNCILTASAIPTAVTANYWGSVNWALYQKAVPVVESKETEPAKTRASSVVQMCLEKYPSYYPPELRSQDAQLRAIFQTMVGESLDDRVVLVFRGLLQPNPSQQIPARIYLTTTHCYLYGHFLGMSSTKIVNLKELVSIEGRTGISQDLLYMISENGSTSCGLFLDSGRVLQKRCQFLIDNVHSEKPLGLEQVLDKLRALGSNLKEEGWIDEDLAPGANESVVTKSTGDAEDHEATEKKLLYLYMTSFMGNHSHGHTNSVPHAAVPPVPTEADILQKSTTVADMSKLMSQLSMETEFDIPAKALFHIMFGETSPVFRYPESGAVTREAIQLNPWKLINSQRMERDIQYNIVESSVAPDNEKENVLTVQRLEKLEDNSCYIVYERRAIWQLAQSGSFYTTYRYVISRLTRNSCNLSIWSSVEWLKPSIFKSEYFIFFYLLLSRELTGI